MKNTKATAFAVAILAASSVQAGQIIDFTSMADKAYSSGSTLNYGEKGFSSFVFNGIGFDLTITGGYKGSAADGAFAYLDKKHAGLGVCGILSPSPDFQCVPSSDDNVTGIGADMGTWEVLTFTFSGFGNDILTIDNVWLNNTHDPDPGGQITATEALLVNGAETSGPGNGYAPKNASNPTTNDYNGTSALNASVNNSLTNVSLVGGKSFTLGYGFIAPTSLSPEQFYVSGMEVSVLDVPNVSVPVPGSMLLLGTGLIGLRLARRRSSKHS